MRLTKNRWIEQFKKLMCSSNSSSRVVAWLSSSSTLVLINVVTLHRASLYETNHLGQLSLPFLWGRLIKYQPF